MLPGQTNMVEVEGGNSDPGEIVDLGAEGNAPQGGDGEQAVVSAETVSVSAQVDGVLEFEEPSSQPYVTRQQADRIVTLIGQGWEPDIIFERVGVEIRTG